MNDMKIPTHTLTLKTLPHHPSFLLYVRSQPKIWGITKIIPGTIKTKVRVYDCVSMTGAPSSSRRVKPVLW